MYKTTSRSMQKSDGRDCSYRSPRPRSPFARATPDELLDFDTGPMPKRVLLDSLKPVMRRLRAEGKPSPGEIAKRLNAEGWTTSQGRRWDGRKVIILIRLLAEDAARQRAERMAGNPTKPTMVSSKEPLSPTELSRRLAALGRVKTGTQPT